MPSGITVGCGLGVVFQQPARGLHGAVADGVVRVGLVIVITFARAKKGAARLQTDPIRPNEPKRVLKIAGIGAGVFLVGLMGYAAWAGSFAGDGGDTYDSGQ